MARALDDGLVTAATSVLDYGCGRGGDVERLKRMGITCGGYDPTFFPHTPRKPADVVNLGFVVNVIEKPRERVQVLKRAWSLAEHVLVVSARLEDESKDFRGEHCGDGMLTGGGTFQKLYTQQSLRHWIETTLAKQSVAAAPGVFYVFREQQAEQAFLAARVHRRALPSSQSSEVLFEQHQELLTPLIKFLSEHGRLPRAGELPEAANVVTALGSLKRAFSIIRRITGEERWDRIRLGRYEDLLVYLALSRFGRRPKLSHLPERLQYDIKDFFGSYKAGCDQADRLLFSIAESQRVEEACVAARVGKRTPDALYVHRTAVGSLAPILRTLEGCARVLVGTIDEATIVKFHAGRPRISYLGYRAFDEDPHPALHFAYLVDVAGLRADYRDYEEVGNPPILHRKELFVDESHPLRARFARLSAQEQRLGLFSEPHRIGTRRGWEELLAAKGVVVRGHRATRAVRATGSA